MFKYTGSIAPLSRRIVFNIEEMASGTIGKYNARHPSLLFLKHPFRAYPVIDRRSRPRDALVVEQSEQSARPPKAFDIRMVSQVRFLKYVAILHK